MYNLQKIAEATYLLPQDGSMQVPGLVIATESLLKAMEMDKALQQVQNVAHLPGIIGHSIAMPDMHWGYGFPIGGVAATDAEHGVISPGGVGYDINCGVRLALVKMPFAALKKNEQDKLLKAIFSKVPSGMGQGGKKALSNADYASLLQQGARWSIEQGFGLEGDLLHTESGGCIAGADVDAVSRSAKTRGAKQLGSIGSGNHFVEIGAISEIYCNDICRSWNIEEGDTYILIHSGSRGFGHQVCQDYLHAFMQLGYGKDVPDPQLIAAPIHSPIGQKYFSGMAAAANFAFNNRQRILHAIRESFKEVLGLAPEEVRLLYDVCHNIAKFETHQVAGQWKKVCVHRKGATRAFGPGNEELAEVFRSTGQPVLVPGDMGRASHLMAGLGNPLTWCSCCHGAGRAMGRRKSAALWQGKSALGHMQSLGVAVMTTSMATISEEMPEAYKDVNEVVQACQLAGLAKMVAKLKPKLVVKG